MKTLMLYGSLGAQFGKVHRYNVSSPVESIKALSATLEGFKQSFIDGGSYRILIGGKTPVNLEEADYPVSDRETIRIIPVIAGAGDAGLNKLIIGGALIFFSGGLAAGASWGSAAVAQVGLSLAIGGVSQMLFSPQAGGDSQERPENKPSFIFNGAVNTTRQGNPVPICYGRMIVGSQVISVGLTVAEV
jgi:predicted phage tail protein|tara:strand:- start:1967 stop:2533 length:567 start_codon:yes stop_codon:yes gene_type:complete